MKIEELAEEDRDVALFFAELLSARRQAKALAESTGDDTVLRVIEALWAVACDNSEQVQRFALNELDEFRIQYKRRQAGGEAKAAKKAAASQWREEIYLRAFKKLRTKAHRKIGPDRLIGHARRLLASDDPLRDDLTRYSANKFLKSRR